MSILRRLDAWRDSGEISPAQHDVLAALSSGERLSLYLELNALMYLGVAAIAGGIGWVVKVYFENIGDTAIVAALAAVCAACLYYCVGRAAPYTRGQAESPTLAFDYVLYLGCLVFGTLLGYVQVRLLHSTWSTPEVLCAVSAAVYFAGAYRYDNRFVLSLACTALAGVFGLTLTRWGYDSAGPLVHSALAFSALVAAGGAALYRAGIKPHFLDTYVHLAAITALVAVTFRSDHLAYFLLLAIISGAVAWYGFERRSAWLVGYAVIAAYVGITVNVFRNPWMAIFGLYYSLFSLAAIIALLTMVARRFGRDE